jgi:hypothetical protein
MGLYTQQDPIGIAGGLNLYGYANGDPVNYSDPFGLCPPVESCLAMLSAIQAFSEITGVSSLTLPAGARGGVPGRPALGYQAMLPTTFSVAQGADESFVTMSGALEIDLNGDPYPFFAEEASVGVESGDVQLSGTGYFLGLVPLEVTISGKLGEGLSGEWCLAEICRPIEGLPGGN